MSIDVFTRPPAEDLSWVSFTGSEPGGPCCWRDCTAQATHVGIFHVICICVHPRKLYCLTHRDMVIQNAAEVDVLVCRACGPDSRKLLIRMEALR